MLVQQGTNCVLRTDRTLPAVVVSIANSSLSVTTNASAFVSGFGSSCVTLEYWVFVRTMVNDVATDSPFNLQFTDTVQ